MAEIVTPANCLSLPLLNLRELLVRCPSWQNWLNVPDSDTDEIRRSKAELRTHYIEIDPPKSGNVEFTVEELESIRPYAVVDIYDLPRTMRDQALVSELISDSTYLDKGILMLVLEDNVPKRYADDTRWPKLDFMNRVGAVMDDIKALSGTDNLLYVSKMELMRIDRPDRTEISTTGDYMRAFLRIDWGVG